MNKLIIILTALMLTACSSTTRTEYVELEPIIKTEYVYVKCQVPKELLSVNNIVIEKEKAIEILKKIAKETNDRKRKLETINKIECIESN